MSTALVRSRDKDIDGRVKSTVILFLFVFYYIVFDLVVFAMPHFLMFLIVSNL